MIITIVGGGSTFTAGIVKSIALRKDEFLPLILFFRKCHGRL